MQVIITVDVPDWLSKMCRAEDNSGAHALINRMVADASNPLAVFGMDHKTSDRWADLTGVVVYDPDGWDRTNYQYSWFEDLITLTEFKRRVFMSTVSFDSLKMLDSL
jgi:hypothetical protein